MELFDISQDQTAQEEGAWINDFAREAGDLELFVLGAQATSLRELNQKLTREREPHYMSDEGYRQEREDYETREKAKGALLGWKNLAIGGKPVEYSKEMAAKIIDDPRFDNFTAFVYNAIAKVNRIRAKFDEEAEKNFFAGTKQNSKAQPDSSKS